jgi:hypothetical protein
MVRALVEGLRVDFKLCLRTNVWVAAAQTLVVLSLDLSSYQGGAL